MTEDASNPTQDGEQFVWTCLAAFRDEQYNEMRYATPFPNLAGCMTAFGTATVHLLVAILLACPYFCLSNVAAMRGPSAVRKHHSNGCNCCSRPDPQDSKQCPGQPDSRQGSGTCLCHGAIMAPHVETPDLHQAVVTVLPLDAALLVRQSLIVEQGFSTGQVTCHFPAADSGRELRALIASLLL